VLRLADPLKSAEKQNSADTQSLSAKEAKAGSSKKSEVPLNQLLRNIISTIAKNDEKNSSKGQEGATESAASRSAFKSFGDANRRLSVPEEAEQEEERGFFGPMEMGPPPFERMQMARGFLPPPGFRMPLLPPMMSEEEFARDEGVKTKSKSLSEDNVKQLDDEGLKRLMRKQEAEIGRILDKLIDEKLESKLKAYPTIASRKTQKQGKLTSLKKRVQKILDKELEKRMDFGSEAFDLPQGQLPMPMYPALREPPFDPSYARPPMSPAFQPQPMAPAFRPPPMDPRFEMYDRPPQFQPMRMMPGEDFEGPGALDMADYP